MFNVPKAPDALQTQTSIKKFFFIQKISFAAIGLDPTSIKRTMFRPWLTFIPLVSMIAVLGPMGIYAFNNMKIDLGKAMAALSPFWQASLAIVKLFVFMLNRKKIVGLVREVWLWSFEANEEELQIIADENKKDSKICTFYYSMVNVTGVLATLAPLGVASIYAWQGHDFMESLDTPFKAEYFTNPKESYIIYILCFIWNVIGIYFIVMGSLSIDTLYSWFVHNISAQFRILNLRYRQISERITMHKAMGNYNEEEFIKSTIDCVKYHRRIIQMSERFSEVYKGLVFFKFLVSCMQLACLSFIIPLGGEIADQLFNLSFLMAVTTQLMLYCHGGQNIQDMSTSVNWAIYESFHWHNLSIKSQKLLLLTMIRAQKPCEIRGIFFTTDLSLFVWVYRTAGSFMTMLMSMEDK
ncbi:odorant receptor 45a-like [Musca vetustissima]|uniref:odorant receptor 45a-like n=1 Tax=Musca vetustissima TaxID=27455 RepID=UPI002AB7AE01|nr:odorant receptor 45a-like [Musca vetustissima]